MRSDNATKVVTMPGRKTMKPARWSHQAELEAAARNGRTIDLTVEPGITMRGTLLAADQFTLKVRVTYISGGPVEPTNEVIYKHAIYRHGIVG